MLLNITYFINVALFYVCAQSLKLPYKNIIAKVYLLFGTVLSRSLSRSLEFKPLICDLSRK